MIMNSPKFSQQADDYEQSEGEGFSMPLAIRDKDKKNPSKFWIFSFLQSFSRSCPIVFQ